MSTTNRRPRLRRSDCSGPGLRRVRRGRGFAYLDEQGEPLSDPDTIERIRELAIPPAWREVWICADFRGHLQATGIDAAGRKQYLYHPLWRQRRDQQKFEKMLRFARALPRLRRRIAADLERSSDIDRSRVLACAARLLDIGLFRIGSEAYADDEGGLGLATIHREHVRVSDGAMRFDYPAKSGVRRVHRVTDPPCAALVASLKRRRGRDPRLLAYRDTKRWTVVRSDEINDYLKEHMGEDFSAKDFRTWNATVLAAVALAAGGREATTKTARRRVINQAVRAVAEMLGNTPAVARRSYIDPRVLDRYLSGWTIEVPKRLDAIDERTRRRIERAVLDLLSDETESGAVVQIEPSG